MSRISSLGRVYDAIVAEFAADGDGTHVSFGKREAAKSINQGTGRANRVVVDPRSGNNTGSFGPPRFPTQNPKAVGTFLPSATIFMWAADLSKLNDERAQYEAVTALQERVVAAIFRVAAGGFSLGTVADASTKTERVMGYEWSAVLNLREDLFDFTEPTATVTGSETTYTLDAPPGP